MIHCLGGRVLKPEILDTLPYDQARASLDDLVRLTLRRLLAGLVSPGESFSFLDVAAASGDMGDCVRRWHPRAAVTSLDRLASHLTNCQGARVVGDAYRLPFRKGSFDIVFCSLFLHHFTDEQVINLLAGFGEAARTAVVVVDLERNPVAYYFVPWTRWVFGWDAVTVNDAPISVEAAFRPGELEALARAAGLVNPRAVAYRPAFRIGLTASPR